MKLLMSLGANWICGLPQMTRALESLMVAREVAIDATETVE